MPIEYFIFFKGASKKKTSYYFKSDNKNAPDYSMSWFGPSAITQGRLRLTITATLGHATFNAFALYDQLILADSHLLLPSPACTWRSL